MIALASIARVAVYARVSTTRQAEADLSVPDQLRAAEAWCAARGWTVTDTFVEPGASGMDEDRPVFQRMIEAATGPARPYDVILVHSLSRFFRDAMFAEMYVRRLRRVGVSVLSITQEFGSDTTGDVVRKILSVFDEYQSRENAKHTHRAMVENARQGFWNGSIPPFGYCVVAAGQKGARTKKVLVVDESEAVMVRRIFALYLGESGLPQGIKAIAKTLNAEGARFRGKRFATSNVHRVLTEEAYAGTHWFNKRDSRTRERRPRSAWVPMPTPVIIPPETFARAAALLAERNPKRTPPRVVNGPMMLAGIARCQACGAGLTLRTGKHGQYRYYACAGRAQKGPTVCAGCSVPMERLDRIVLEQLGQRVFRPERLEALLADTLAASKDAATERTRRMARLRADLTECEGRLHRLMDGIERGLLDLDDPGLKNRLTDLKARRARLSAEIEHSTNGAGTPMPVLTPGKLTRLSRAMTGMLRDGPADLRRAYVRLFVDRVVVSRSEIRISGPTAALARAAAADPQTEPEQVLSFIQAWRPVRVPIQRFRAVHKGTVKRAETGRRGRGTTNLHRHATMCSVVALQRW